MAIDIFEILMSVHRNVWECVTRVFVATDLLEWVGGFLLVSAVMGVLLIPMVRGGIK